MLQRNKITLGRVIDARKSALAGEEAWNLLAGVNEIIVASGKKQLRFDPHRDSKEEILKQVLGRSGTLRAPTLLMGDRLLVGYSDTLYAHYLG